MPRTKKASRRGRGGARSGHRGGNRGGGGNYGRHLESEDEMDFVPFGSRLGLGSRHAVGAFSMQNEALNTQRPHNWNSDQKLRHAKVNFISAGDLQPVEITEQDEPETTAALADMSLDPPLASAGNSTKPSSLAQDTPGETEDEILNSFVVDTTASNINTGLPPPQIRSSSPTPSDSSEEIILFRGRDSRGRGIRRATPPKNTSSDLYDARLQTIDNEIHEKERLLATSMDEHERARKSFSPYQLSDSVDASNADTKSISVDESQEAFRGSSLASQPSRVETIIVEVERSRSPSRERKWAPRSDKSYQDKLSKSQKRRTEREIKAAEEQALIDDYIANMEDGELNQNRLYNNRELGGEDIEVWEETESSLDNDTKKAGTGEWDREDLDDFDDLSTSDGILGAIQAILSKRERPSGLQYLVVYEDQNVDEARWILHTNLNDPATNLLVEEFEAEEKLIVEFMGDDDEEDSDEDSDDNNNGDDVDSDDDSDDEADLIRRKIERMSDEKIARLLEKQEQLGMGSDELLLFDDSADGEHLPLDMDVLFSARQRPKPRPRGPNRARGDFPAATALADAYDGFDVMDYERPSLALKKKTKGRKGKLLLDISDSELEESMQMAWNNDRLKKKKRKEEREELRSAGLLGKKNGKLDMSAKYKEGMGISAVKDEIKAFLMGNNTTLALPPMDKADRKVVHEIANAFNMKSKSAGSGKTRFPVLYRTQRTSPYRESMFNAVESRISKRFLPRMDLKGKKPARAGGRSGGFVSSAVSYRDGDVVGALAPELGIENKGRAMLEKMGWSSGTALGALNNKGILQPVSHVVKTTKAGLG